MVCSFNLIFIIFNFDYSLLFPSLPPSPYPLPFPTIPLYCHAFFWQILLKIFYMCIGVYVCMSLCVFVWVYMHTCAHEDQKRAFSLLELRLLVCMTHLGWVVGPRSGPHHWEVSAIYCWVISLVLFFLHKFSIHYWLNPYPLSSVGYRNNSIISTPHTC